MASRRKKKPEAPVAAVTQTPISAVSEGRSWLWFWLFAAGIVIAGVVYSPALDGPFVYDDHHLPFDNPDAARMPAKFWIGGVRPVLMATYWVNYLISGSRTVSYHAFNLLFHVAAAVTVFFLMRRLLKLAGIEGNTFWVSLFGAALFLLHPLQTESVAYVAGRSELVSGLLVLLAWLVFLQHFESKTTLATALKILLLAAAALLGKESAISLVAVLFITDLYWNRASLWDVLRSRVKLYAPIIAGGIVASIVIVRSLSKASGAGLSLEAVTPLRYALTQCRVILTYIRLFLIPMGQSGDWQMPFFRSLADRNAWLYVFGMLVLLGVIAFSYRRSPLFSFGLLTFLVFLLPTSSVIPINDALAERRMYLAIIGLILASVAIVQRFHLDVPVLRTVATLLLILAAVLTFQRSQVWGDDIAFWKNVIESNPGNSRAHLDLGGSYLRHQQFMDAVKEYDAVDKLDGASEQTMLNRVAAYEQMGNFDLALDALHKAAAMHPTPSTYKDIGHLEAWVGHIDDSLAAFSLALALDPKYAAAYAQRGMIYLATGNSSRARADFQNALNIEPDNDIAKTGLSRLAGSH